jgi:hypothetical protein
VAGGSSDRARAEIAMVLASTAAMSAVGVVEEGFDRRQQMFELILIFAVSFLIVPLFDQLIANPTDPEARRLRTCKIIVLVLTIVWLIFLLFFPSSPVALYPRSVK